MSLILEPLLEWQKERIDRWMMPDEEKPYISVSSAVGVWCVKGCSGNVYNILSAAYITED